MKTFFTILKVNLLNFLVPTGNFKKNKKGKNKAKGKSGLAVFLILMYALMGFYAAYLTYYVKDTPKELGIRDMGLTFGITMSVMISLIFTFSNAHAVLFKARDFDMLMCLPIDKKTVIASKLVTVSVLGYVYFSFCYLPALVAYLVMVEFSLTILFYGLLVFLVAPLLVTTISAFLSIFLGYITRKSKYKNVLQSISYLVILLAICAFSFTLSFNSGSAQSDVNAFAGMKKQFLQFNPIGPMMYEAMNGDLIKLGELALISIVPFICFLLICGKLYVKLNAASKEGYKNKNFKLQEELKTKSPMKALISREFKTFIGTPVYMTNVIISPIMGAVLMIILSVYAMTSLPGMIAIPEEGLTVEIVKEWISTYSPMILVAAGAWTFGMSPATSVIINMEGKNFWVVKSLPVTDKQIVISKALFNIILYLPFILVAGITTAIIIKPSVIDAICIIVAPILFSLAYTFIGLLFNTKFYNLDWDNPTQAVKSGAGMLLTLLVDLILSAILIIPCVFMFKYNMLHLSHTIIVYGVILVAVSSWLLFTVGMKNFRKIPA